ncbi:MAG: hypothetical protein JNK05_02475 [Myxococcales bacterium]|nr:hypothetical protein [Myxococcales bacterium]
MRRSGSSSLVAVCVALSGVFGARASLAQSATPSVAMRACERARVVGHRSLQAAAAALRIPRATPFHAAGYYLCLDAKRGAWLVGIDRPVVRRADGRAALVGGDVTITFFSAEGVAIRTPSEILGLHRRVADRPTQYGAVRDIDGDEAGELVFEAYSPRSMQAFAVIDGRVVAYVPPEHIRANATSDIDRDGRVELVEHVSMQPTEECRERLLYSNDLISWVSMREGARYRPDTDGARAWLRAQCPERPTVFVPTHGVTSSNAATTFREMVQRVACGRAWGVSPEAIGRAAPARWPAPIACMTTADLVRFAASIRPPVTLAPITGIVAPRADAPNHFTGIDLDDFDPNTMPVPQELPALGRRCAANENAMRRAFNAVVAASNQSISLDELDEFFGDFPRCFASDSRDVWMTSFDRLRWVENTETDETGINGTSRIMHLDVNGRAVAQSADSISRFDGRVSLRRVIATFDFDGDRTSEAIVRAMESREDEDSDSYLAMLTVANGAVRPYEPRGGVPAFSRIVDFDEDERPDLVDPRCNAAPDDDHEGYTGPQCLSHSRPDGTFSNDDSVARDFIAAQCPAPPERIVVLADGVASVQRHETYGTILCARYYGESAERLVQRIIVESRGRDDDDRQWLRDISTVAAWRMPFTLPRPTPAPTQRAAPDAGATP